MVGHVLGEPAGIGRQPDRLGDFADVHRGRAAAHADVVDAQVEGLLGERTDLVAVRLQGIESGGERASVRGGHLGAGVGEVEERRLGLRGAVGDRQGADVTGHGRADLLQPRQHRRRSAEAVEADDIDAELFETLRSLDDPDPVGHLLEAHGRKREDDGQAAGLGDLGRGDGLTGEVEGLADDEVGAFLDRPCDHLGEHGPHLGLLGLIGGIPDVRVRDVAGHEVPGLGVGNGPGDLQGGAVERLEQVLLADHAHLLTVSVVGEGLDDVGTGPLEVDVEGTQGVGEFEGHLGDELAGGQISALLELEQETFRADHGAGVEALGQGVGRGHGCSPIR